MDLETIKTLGAALTSIKTLSDIADTISNAKVRQEFNGKIADLQGVVIAARQQMLTMQDKYEELLRENKQLKEQLKESEAPREKPSMKWGCYQFEGEDGLFCTACYDTKGKKHRTTRINSNLRQCPVCKSSLGSG